MFIFGLCLTIKNNIMKTLKRNLIYSKEGMNVESISFKLDNETKTIINLAKNVIRDNPILTSVNINGDKLASTVLQYDSTLDDDEKSLLKGDDIYKTDLHRIIIYKDGTVFFKAYGKYDSSNFYEVEI